jgi:hypothetical protein
MWMDQRILVSFTGIGRSFIESSVAENPNISMSSLRMIRSAFVPMQAMLSMLFGKV